LQAPPPPDEKERLEALGRYEILDTDREQGFDDIALLASHLCGTPIALISLIDENRQWFKSKVGMAGSETPREIAFCAHGILESEVFIVNDAQADERFAANPLVTGDPRIRFYAGSPLRTPDGHALGTLCVIDYIPRQLSAEQKTALEALSRQVVFRLESRRSLTELRQTTAQLEHEQELLRRKTAFLEAQVNSSMDGMLLVDQDGKQTLQNQRFIDLFKIPRQIADEKTDENRLRWVTEMTKEPEEFLQKVRYLYAHPDEISRDEIDLKNGTILDRYSSPVSGEDEEYYGRIWTFRDITERKRTENALRESEERFSGAFEHAPIGVGLASPEGRWIKVNRALCDLIGYTEAELLARTFQDITQPEDMEVSIENVRRIIAGEIDSYQAEKHYVHARGRIITVLLNVSLVRDGRGHALYFIAQIQDITERKRTENALRESEERFSGAFEHAPIGMALGVPNGPWLKVNRAFCDLVGYSEAELLIRTFRDITHPDDVETSAESARQLFAGEIRSFQIEKRYIHKRGHLVAVLLNISTFTSPMQAQAARSQLFQSQKMETVGKLAGRHRA
jgi:PAS domain S-box-containing protein